MQHSDLLRASIDYISYMIVIFLQLKFTKVQMRQPASFAPINHLCHLPEITRRHFHLIVRGSSVHSQVRLQRHSLRDMGGWGLERGATPPAALPLTGLGEKSEERTARQSARTAGKT